MPSVKERVLPLLMEMIGVVEVSWREEEILTFPLESTNRYFVEESLLVTEKISTVPANAWATTNPVAELTVGVMV